MAVYYLFPNLTYNVPKFKNPNIVNIDTVPSRLRLVFCIYQLYKPFMRNDLIYGVNEAKDSLDLS
jgi:hypothetical protein